MTPQIIFENEDFVAINKPAGLLVHRPKIKNKKQKIKNLEHTLVDWLLKKYPEIKTVGDPSASSVQVIQDRPGIVHRLDKDTSGIMLIPKNQAYFEYLKSLFRESKIKKIYLAIVYGVPKKKKGIIDKPIGIKDGTVKRSVFSKKMAKPAITEYKVLKTYSFQCSPSIGSETADLIPERNRVESKDYQISLLQVSPKTGRTHQIRVHLAFIGSPVLGDKFYGGKSNDIASRKMGILRQMLHADSIEFPMKPGRVIKLSAEMPEDFRRICGYPSNTIASGL